MIIALGTDHGGYHLKNPVIDAITLAGHEVLDLGTFDETPVDYPDYAKSVADAVVSKRSDRGILICGSGVGACVAANKITGIRVGLCHDTYSAHQGVEHDDMNVLCLGARIVGKALAQELVKAFLAANFTAEARHMRRLEKVSALEKSPQHE